jgi:hypothetical protein
MADDSDLLGGPGASPADSDRGIVASTSNESSGTLVSSAVGTVASGAVSSSSGIGGGSSSSAAAAAKDGIVKDEGERSKTT